MSMLRYSLILVVLGLAAAANSADRTSADAYLAGVPALVNGGDYKTTEDLCKRSLQADDTYPLAHYYMALCLEKSGKAHDAFKGYQNAASLATKEKDAAMAAKATAAAKRLGTGLMEIDALDVKLSEKLQKIATEALDTGHLETAKQAFTSLLAIQPENAKAKEGLEKITTALKDRADPIKSKIAGAMLVETFYRLGTGKKDEATELAKELSLKYADTESGKEAAGLIERDFAAPKKDEVVLLAQKLKEQSTKTADASKALVSSGSPTSVSAKPVAKNNVDVEALEKSADDETKKMGKDALVAAFADAYKNGKLFYAKATPGSEGNQENLSKALELFVKAESLFVRIETENLKDDEMAENVKEASMLRYACMKMTILTH